MEKENIGKKFINAAFRIVRWVLTLFLAPTILFFVSSIVNPEIAANFSNTLLEIIELPPLATWSALISGAFLLFIIYLPSVVGKLKRKPKEMPEEVSCEE